MNGVSQALEALVQHLVKQAWSQRIVAWQRIGGRSSLPWQNTQDPYRVWLSEIMLQQTQVVTVLDYYQRFLHAYPDVISLAQASLDEVLALWSGLGYYSRARNLHLCAQVVSRHHGGEFPSTAAELETLPGIGPSTAAAIAAFCFGERAAIFDGNVKRVLARVLAFDGDLARAVPNRQLLACAQALLPAGLDGGLHHPDMAAYTQGLMDLGATVCLPKRAECGRCPLQGLCQSGQKGNPLAFPKKTKTLKRTSQSLWLLSLQHADGTVALVQRPAKGVWAGLWVFPAFESELAMLEVVPSSLHACLTHDAVLVHTLTHKDLHLHRVRLNFQINKSDALAASLLNQIQGRWFSPEAWGALGMPTPMKHWLAELSS